MIVVRVLMNVKPDNRDQFVTVMEQDAAQSRAFEGCQRFDLYQSPSNPRAFVLYEEWASQEAFDVYRNSDYLKGRFGVVMPLLDGNPDSAYYQASLVA